MTGGIVEKKRLMLAGGPGMEKAAKGRWPGAEVVGSVGDLALLEYLLSGMTPDIVAVDPRLKTRGESLDDWMARIGAEHPTVEIALFTEDLPEPSGGSGNLQVIGSQTLVVWSPKGGVGKTFLATNLACAASMATGGKAGLIDLDLYSGDVSVHLDLADGPTVSEMLPALSNLRPEGLDKYSVRHGPSGLAVIRSPRKPELATLLTTENVKDIISLCQKRWGLVYIDTPPDITDDMVGVSIDCASKVLLVVTQDIAALRQCKLACEVFAKLGIPKETVAVVVNRMNKDSLMPPEKIEDYLGTKVLGCVPDDRKQVESAVFHGKPPVLYNKSPVGDALWSIVSSLSPGIKKPFGREKTQKRWGLFN